MPGGTGMPGLTSEANSPRRRPPRTRTAPISVIAAAPGDQPVVSRSTTANSSSLERHHRRIRLVPALPRPD